MSATIKAAITALKGRIAAAYSAISAKGGTLPATQDSANLPAAIASIPAGGGLSTAGFNYTTQGMEYLGQAVWNFESSLEVTEIVDNTSDMSKINNKTFTPTSVFPNLKRITMSKPAILTARYNIMVSLNGLDYAELYLSKIETTATQNSIFGGTCQELVLANLTELDLKAYTKIINGTIKKISFPKLVDGTNLQILTDSNGLIEAYFPLLENWISYNWGIIFRCTSIKKFYAPKLKQLGATAHGYAQVFINPNAFEEVTFGAIDNVEWFTDFFGAAQPNLYKFEVGQDTKIMLSLANWTATNVADDTLLNTNFATYLADRLYDYTGGTAHTLTISTALYNRLTAATLAIVTNKNWTIATA